jgi:hypothetical protein
MQMLYLLLSTAKPIDEEAGEGTFIKQTKNYSQHLNTGTQNTDHLMNPTLFGSGFKWFGFQTVSFRDIKWSKPDQKSNGNS